MAETEDRPRWARDFDAKTWERVNEMLYEGHQPAAVRGALNIPASKKRSLEVYARKFRNRRVIAPVARLREVLAGGVAALGPECVKLLGMMVEQALTDSGKLQRTAEVLGVFVDRVERMATQVQEVEQADAQRSAKDKPSKLSEDAIATLKSIYGLDSDDG